MKKIILLLLFAAASLFAQYQDPGQSSFFMLYNGSASGSGDGAPAEPTNLLAADYNDFTDGAGHWTAVSNIGQFTAPLTVTMPPGWNYFSFESLGNVMEVGVAYDFEINLTTPAGLVVIACNEYQNTGGDAIYTISAGTTENAFSFTPGKRNLCFMWTSAVGGDIVFTKLAMYLH
jgi:hypothetical protein